MEELMMRELDISMCWDGETPTAELCINGESVSGEPETVKSIFFKLCELQDKSISYKFRLLSLKDLFYDLSKKLERLTSLSL